MESPVEYSQVCEQVSEEAVLTDAIIQQPPESDLVQESGQYAMLTPVIMASNVQSAELPAQNFLLHNPNNEFFYTYEGNTPPNEFSNEEEEGSNNSYDPQHDYEPQQGDSYDSAYGMGNFSFEGHPKERKLSNGFKADPFSEHCRIPLPGMAGEGNFVDSRTFVRRRNERERTRVRNVNDGFERLRRHLPIASEPEPKDKRLSKVETLRYAIGYIRHLQSLLND